MEIVAGRYRLGRTLGQGGMATVYEAEQSDGPTVALKVIRPRLALDARACARFHREARAIAAIDHPGVVRVLDWGVADRVPYIAMELIEGISLAQVLTQYGRLSKRSALSVVHELCNILEAAHRRGIVHRDMKPHNVMVMPGGEVRLKVIDFGVAKLMRPCAGSDVTMPIDLSTNGMIIGTPPYMAPEQLLGGNIDGRADVYAVGVMLYRMISGRLPWKGSSPMGTAVQQLKHAPAPIAKVDPDIAALIEQCIARDPADRFETTGALRAAVRRVLSQPPWKEPPWKEPPSKKPASKKPASKEPASEEPASEGRRDKADATLVRERRGCRTDWVTLSVAGAAAALLIGSVSAFSLM